ncbi:hypothetical protein [Streptomyces sp. NPDC096032]|uniref:hypothetical protein n=1 Tax=Streptomyces sp. NPDC096032 TaxID=3366070 RepID=UPI0037FDD569
MRFPQLPSRRRRAALEALFTDRQLTAPWVLCPSPTDSATVREWRTNWTAVGLEGVVYKRLEGRCARRLGNW